LLPPRLPNAKRLVVHAGISAPIALEEPKAPSRIKSKLPVIPPPPESFTEPQEPRTPIPDGAPPLLATTVKKNGPVPFWKRPKSGNQLRGFRLCG
jgi:hypothetical protein